MAQNPYPTHSYYQQPVYRHPPVAYQPHPYAQTNIYQQPPPTDTQQRYIRGPPLQTQFSSVPSQGPYSPGHQPNGHYHPTQSVVAPAPSNITQQYVYPSPVPLANTPSSFRRPLPNPALSARPGSVAQAEGAAFSAQSRPPTIHRPSSSLSMPPSSGSRVSSTVSKFSALSVNSPSMPQISGRPLPQPGSRSAQNAEPSHNGSPVTGTGSPHSTGSLPISSNTQPRPPQQPELPASGQRFVPLWKRALPSPSINLNPTSPTNSTPVTNNVYSVNSGSQPAVRRRPTVSRPLPQSPGTPNQQGPPRGNNLTTTNSHGQLPNSSQSPVTVSQNRSVGADPARTRTEDSVIPTNSPFIRRNRSRTLPQPGQSPTSTHPSYPVAVQKENRPTAQFARTPSSTSAESDDDLSTISLLQRRSIHKDNITPPPRTPSPQYGIKDLPSRRLPANETTPRGPQVNGSRHVRAPSSPARTPPPLPARSNPSPTRASAPPRSSPPKSKSRSPERVPSVIHNPSEPQSSIYKFAVMDLGYKPPSSPIKQKDDHPMPEMTRTKAQQPRWPDNVPRLPRPPTQPPTQSRDRSPVRELPIRTQSLDNPVANTPFKSIQSQKRLPPNLDDAPPPSLRRSPSPGPTRRALPNIETRDGQRSPVPRTPVSAVTPDSAASMFSLSEFPVPPPLPSHVKPKEGGPRSPQRPSPRQDSGRPSIPKISFPADPNDDSDDSDAGGPVINVSGPGEESAGPVISIGNFDDDDNGQFPGISISVADDSGPVQQRRKARDLPPPASVLGKGGRFCGGCGGTIIGRIVSAMGERWHPTCFKCVICDEHLENLSSYEHEGRPYCHLDYHEMFAPRCYHCQTTIADEIFITLDDPDLGKRTYHEQHFFCAECGDPFVPPGSGSRSFKGDGVFKADEDDVGFTVYKGHPYCEACHVRLRLPKCKKCKKSIRDGTEALEALGGKWCWNCFTCAGCDKPFDTPMFYEKDNKPFCHPCYDIIIKSELWGR